MRQFITLVVSAWLFSVVLSAGQATPKSADEAAIRTLVGKYAVARNTMNTGAARVLFTTDADQLVSTGEWRKGIDAVVGASMATSRKETGKSEITIESIRFLDFKVGIVDARYETVSARDGITRKMWTTLVVKRGDGGWRIAAIRNMLPSPPPKAAIP